MIKIIKETGMQGKKPTYEQRKFLERNDLDTYEWLVQKDTPNFMQLVSKESGKTITIEKD